MTSAKGKFNPFKGSEKEAPAEAPLPVAKDTRDPAKQRDMSHPSPLVAWSADFKPFGDRLDFLSPERQHLNTGKLRILPPSNPGRRNARTS